MKKDKGVIVFTKYGPYTVVDTDIVDEEGRKIETPRVISLCRCGESGDIRGTIDYVGEKITVHDNRHICCHHGTCNMEGVFLSEADPWIVPDGSDDLDAIIDVVKKCPSGALIYTVDGKSEDSWTEEQKIIVYLMTAIISIMFMLVNVTLENMRKGKFDVLLRDLSYLRR